MKPIIINIKLDYYQAKAIVRQIRDQMGEWKKKPFNTEAEQRSELKHFKEWKKNGGRV